MLRCPKSLLLALISLSLTDCVLGQTSPCAAGDDCTSCIQLAANCAWCRQLNFAGVSRCIDVASDHGCNDTYIEDPQGGTVNLQNAPLSSTEQVMPQSVRLNLRPGRPQTFRVNVRPARNFPVDVYYLMDQSYSMNDDLINLINLASQIASTIRSISTDFRLGFGSFVDKPRAPYRSEEPDRLTNPCFGDGNCEPTYSFRHSFSFSSDANLFEEFIREEVISGNLDEPEGGMDALLQVLVCSDIIDWRPNARHIVVFLTDAGFHFAGDGKLGGVVRPHDGRCYLQPSGLVFNYNMSNHLDYPSVGQIAAKLREFDVIPIFAATADVLNIYRELTAVLGSAFVGTLAGDSSNIITLIQEVYNTIAQTVRLDLPTGNNNPIRYTTVPQCNVFSATVDGLACEGVEIESTVSFDITAELTDCSGFTGGMSLTQQITIPGFGGSVEVEINGVCDCNCTDFPEPDSNFCNLGNGSLVCGACECNPTWLGERCECAVVDAINTVDNCPRGANNVTCTSSDRGTCVCNRCQCITRPDGGRYYGPACECDDFTCDRDDEGRICGGTEQGRCDCGVCVCNTGYSGGVCDCPTSNATCLSPLSRDQSVHCSGEGMCMCGECRCNRGFRGAFCEICDGGEGVVCPPRQECGFTESCVLCNLTGSSFYCDQANANCTLDRAPNDATNSYNIELAQDTTVCRVASGDCSYQYFVGRTTDTFTPDTILVETGDVDCADDGVEAWIIVVAILGGLLLLAGIILLIVRLIIELRYIIEFRQWKKELEKARFAKNDNPLFRKATEDFVNPAYGK